MQRKNIPSYILARGMSKEGFEQLLDDIRNAAIEEGVKEFSNYYEMIESIKEKDKNGDAEQWVSSFEAQLNESTNIINDNMAKIESLFNRIFADWEVYKQEHNIVEEVKEETPVASENKTEETPAVDENAPVVAEDTTVELEPVPAQAEVGGEEPVVSETEEVKVESESVSQEVSVPEETPVTVEEAKPEEKVEVPVVEEEPTKKTKKSKKDKSEVAEGDNNG